MRFLGVTLVAAMATSGFSAWFCVAAEKPATPSMSIVPAPDPTARPNPWREAARSPTYDQATAVNPGFSDKTLWPVLSDKELYLKQEWPKARLLMWAHPGKNGSPKPKAGGLSSIDPANWLEDGKPAARLWDENTDILLPSADKSYDVSCRDGGVKQIYRHITVERNACFNGGGDGVGRQIKGNVWIKRGGRMGSQGATSFLGTKHTFFRCDNDGSMNKHPESYTSLAQYFEFSKTDGGTVECLGVAQSGDEFGVHACLVIIGPDSVVQAGRNANPVIDRGGTLALLDGAYFGKWVNDWEGPELIVSGGTLQGGLPERPLTRSCTVNLGFKNHTRAQYDGPGAEERFGKKVEYARVPSMIVESASTLRSFSSDIARARLVVTYMGERGVNGGRPIPNIGSGWGDWEYGFWTQRRPDVKERYKWFDALPRGIDVLFARGVAIDGVEFDHLRKGGLMCQDPEARKAWKNVFFGNHNYAAEAELFSILEKIKGRNY